MKTLSCVLRRYGDEWDQIRDGDHVAFGLSRVAVFADKICVYYSFEAEKVVTFHVTADDTFALQGIVPGASVGFRFANILFAKDGKKLRPSELSEDGNIWIQGVFL